MGFIVRTALLSVLVFHVSVLQAYDQKAERVLDGLNPETRLVKICELEGMDRIDSDKNSLHPEHVMIDYLKPPHYSSANSVWGNHALLRSRGVWYYLAYQCSTNPDHSKVTHFSYKLGKKIERSQWDELGLFP